MRYLFDTDVLVEVMRGNAVVIEQVRELEHAGSILYCTPVIRAEIYANSRHYPMKELSFHHLDRRQPT